MGSKKQKRQPTGDYPIGYCRPPAQHQFRLGQSGNPSGQRKGRQDKTTADELKEILATKVTIRDGGKPRQVSLFVANLLAHAMNGAKGDARSAALFLNQAQKLGLLDNQQHSDIRPEPANKSRPSEVLLEGVDPNLLSRDEQLELSQLASVIDRAGDTWALGSNALERMRELVNKGRSQQSTADLLHFRRQITS
jgi:hypothetical protein